ncbi:MAG TPA: hypothetical protein VD963_08205, partial [Phycisphaerales bacterium]|nr:hypothetical protein [Phycisphaerales bacterium]
VVGERTGLAGLRDVRGAGGRAGGGALVDSVNASGREGARLLMGALGVPLRHVGDRDTGRFGRPPEPTAENLAGLSAVAAEAGVAVGFAQDPDGDRLAVLDEAGRYIGEEYTLALAAESVLGAMGEAARGAVVVANLSTSRMVEDVAWRHGAVVARAPVGEANVVAEMRAQARAGRRVVLGGEGNGGVIWPEVVLVRDSLGAMALVLALLARTGRTVSELAAGVPRYAIVKRKVELRERAGVAGALARVSAALAGEGAVVDQRDGVWVGRAAERWWVHVRASNTEPIMRLIAEAPTEATARGLLDRAGEALAG